jgi:hypothetical protein
MEDTDQFYLDFKVEDQERFISLCRVFEALRHDKEKQLNAQDEAEATQAFREDDQWLIFFDERAQAHFWWPSQQELDTHSAQWFATPLPTRWSDPALKRPWMFFAMIDAFKNAEFELLSCRGLSSNTARISFFPLAWPYGGTGCLKALVEAFAFEVVAESSGA